MCLCIRDVWKSLPVVMGYSRLGAGEEVTHTRNI